MSYEITMTIHDSETHEEVMEPTVFVAAGPIDADHVIRGAAWEAQRAMRSHEDHVGTLQDRG
jgi:hypothetical protein